MATPSRAWTKTTKSSSTGNVHYIDPAHPSASDSNAGTSASAPLATLAKLDAILRGGPIGNSTWFIANGSVFTAPRQDGFVIKTTGTSATVRALIQNYVGYVNTTVQPVIKAMNTTYGSGNNAMTLGSDTGSTVDAIGVTIDGIDFQDAPNYGLLLNTKSSDCLVKNGEFSNCGTGVVSKGANNAVRFNYFHDMIMIVSDSSPNNDYGANGVQLWNKGGQEVTDNTFFRCKASSVDYGTDGGAVEWFSDGSLTATGVIVARNWAEDCNGFMEIGGSSTATLSGAQLNRNLALNSGGFGWIHNDTSMPDGTNVTGLEIQYNTLVQDSPSSTSQALGFDKQPTSTEVSVHNNVWSMDNGTAFYVFSTTPGSFTASWHTNNVYDRSSAHIPTLFSGADAPFGTGELAKNGVEIFNNRASFDFTLNFAGAYGVYG
jgi:hypothetical protein